MAAILITDDDRTCRDSMQMALERAGHCVEGACDVESALRALAERHFDLIVCDYRMPGKTGLDLLVQLKQDRSPIPFLMVSAFADAHTEAVASELGAGVLKKPFRRRVLLETVDGAIKQDRTLRL